MELSPKQTGTIAWFARNPVAANLLLVLISLSGIFSIFSIEKEAQPQMLLKRIQVMVPFPGATPEEVERGICIKIEEALSDVQGIKEINSVANESRGTVTIEVLEDYDIFEVLDEVNITVNSIFTFPEEAERPIITRVKQEDDIIDIQIYGNVDEKEMTRITKEIRTELLALPEISRVDLNDTRDYEIAIEVSENALREYGITLSDVSRAIRQSSVDLPGGLVKTENFDIRVRTDGKAFTGSEFEAITLLKTEDGGRITIGDIATVNDGFVEDRRHPTFDGKPSTSLSVFSIEGQSELVIAKAVREFVAKKQQELPEGIFIETWADGSHYLKGRLNLMLNNLGLGALLVLLLLGFFLRLKVAFWVVVGIPVCFLGTLWVMPMFGISVNMISLFGFILVLGILVDDAIVIGENVYSYVEKHGASEDNVIAGARQVAMPATFGVLTTVVAFIPMTMISGESGPLWKSVGAVVVFALLFSLVESKWILPAHLMSLGKVKPKTKKGFVTRIQDRVDAVLKWIIVRLYRPTLEKLLEFRYATLAGFVALLIVAIGAVSGGIVRFVFFPSIPSDFIFGSVQMQSGVAFSDLRGAVDKMESALAELDVEIEEDTGDRLVKHTRSWLNSRSSGFMFVELNPSETRNLDAGQLSRMWSERVGRLPGVENMNIGGNAGGASVGLNLVSKDLEVLEEVADQITDKLLTYEGVFNVRSSLSDGPPEVILEIKPEAEAMGLSLADVASQARAAFYGIEAQRVQRGEDEVKVMVRYPIEERSKLESLETMYFRTPDGRELPFSAVAAFDYDTGYNSIRRYNGMRAVSINASVDRAIVEPGKITGEVRTYFEEELKPRYPGVDYRLTGQSLEEEEALNDLMMGLGVALLVIYALMAIPLKSYVQPLFIMSVIPFGFIGAAVGHWLLGLPISILSLCGLIALAGVVVNDSLIMVDFVNQGVRSGLSVPEAARDAGIRRFRAILLTSLTTFIGLIPIISENSMQAQMVIPMAVTLAFGILFSTGVTLLLIPTLYLISNDIKGLVSKFIDLIFDRPSADLNPQV
ncbi:MAG: efflux RND transporter permease subunit [Opitutales bacterium]